MNTELVRIPEYTADDFYNTSDPYAFLYQYIDDKFLLSQMREKLKAKAASVGVKGFVGLWNAYLESVQKQKGLVMDNATAFEDQEIELFSGQYICDEQGVTMVDKYGYELVVCRHPIMPVQRLVNIDSGEERLKIAYKKGNSWRFIIVEKSVIASATGILQLAANGIMVNSENAKMLSTYLLEMEQLNYLDLPEQKSVGRLGWIGDHGFSPYVDNLAFDGDKNFNHTFSAVKSAGSREKWIEAMRDVRSYGTAGRLFLATSFASAILDPCGLLPFFLHAWGTTECGKTVGLMVAASVWACPKMGEYITTFNSTIVGQEMMASFLNSMPMCIDELQIKSSEGMRDFDRIIYQLTEGVGRTRGAKTGGLQRINTWKNCFISNGEHPISNAKSGGGAVNRIIEFECTEKVYSDLVGLCAIINQNYGWAGKEFVQYLQQDGVINKVVDLQKEYYRQLLKSDSTDKQAASASAILAADKIATDLIFQDGRNLTVKDLVQFMTKKADVDANVRAYEYLMEVVARNPLRFHTNDYGEYQGEVWGKIEGNYIYIVKSVFDSEMSGGGFNGTAFLSWAKRMGYLDANRERRTKKIRILGTPVNCVCLLRKQDEQEYEQVIIDEDLDIL